MRIECLNNFASPMPIANNKSRNRFDSTKRVNSAKPTDRLTMIPKIRGSNMKLQMSEDRDLNVDENILIAWG